MGHLFIFGLGYTAKRIKALAETAGWRVDATGSDGNLDFDDRAAIVRTLARATHVLSSIPPNRETSEDPVLESYYEEVLSLEMGHGEGLFYLSSTGVYGDQQGAWVDESSPAGSGRRAARAVADRAWFEMGARVFRLPGIYGPGRSALERVREGAAHRIDQPGQVFSRVHVEDIAKGVMAAMASVAPRGAYNLADDLPTSQNTVIEYACRLSGLPLPPLQTLKEAQLGPMARGFYAENRRVANGKAKRLLGWQPSYPTYREGLASLLTGT